MSLNSSVSVSVYSESKADPPTEVLAYPTRQRDWQECEGGDPPGPELPAGPAATTGLEPGESAAVVFVRGLPRKLGHPQAVVCGCVGVCVCVSLPRENNNNK